MAKTKAKRKYTKRSSYWATMTKMPAPMPKPEPKPTLTPGERLDKACFLLHDLKDRATELGMTKVTADLETILKLLGDS